MSLYNIANEYQDILAQTFDPETGEINETALAKLDEVKTDIREKGIAVASFIKNIEAERNAIEDAKKSMAEREARLDKRANYLTSYLKSNMERCGITEISCAFFDVKIKKNPVSVDVYDEASLPENYIKKKIVITHSVDKMKIKEEILAGVVIPGAALRQNTRLEIR
jgi:outer membrane murein-binding lipoprotein Lpp